MFNPNEHLSSVKGQSYLEVKWRLAWFRSEHPGGSITTEIVTLDVERGLAVVKAFVTTEDGAMATGTKMECARHFGDYLEKAETGSVGRALAALGYGTQFTGDELDEGRIVDSPVAR